MTTYHPARVFLKEGYTEEWGKYPVVFIPNVKVLPEILGWGFPLGYGLFEPKEKDDELTLISHVQSFYNSLLTNSITIDEFAEQAVKDINGAENVHFERELPTYDLLISKNEHENKYGLRPLTNRQMKKFLRTALTALEGR